MTRHYAYGNVRTPAPTTPCRGALPTDYTFTGQRRDASAGLMYYGARYYDATLGRFVSADTVVPNAGNPQSLNRYAYTLNNPVRYTDPTGHFTDEEIQKSLKDEYGENWERVWKAWQEDEYWMWLLDEAKAGYDIWLANTELGFGTFDQDPKSGRITVHFRQRSDVNLWQIQNVGAYQLRGPDGERPEFGNLIAGVTRPRFAYDSRGNLESDQPIGYQRVARFRLEFDNKLNPFAAILGIFGQSPEKQWFGDKFIPLSWGPADFEKNPIPDEPLTVFGIFAGPVESILLAGGELRNSDFIYPIRYYIKDCGNARCY